MKYKGFTYTPTPKTAWDNLSMLEKSEMMRVAVSNGITNLQEIKDKYNEFAMGGDKRGRMPAHPRNREKDPEAYDAAQQWRAERQQRIQQQEEQNRTYVEEKAERNARAAEEFNRHKDTVMSALSDIADSVPFTGSEVIDAANAQRQEKLDKWYDIKKGINATTTAAELGLSGASLLGAYANWKNWATAANATKKGIANLLRRAQLPMQVTGTAIDGYQTYDANSRGNDFDTYYNGASGALGVAGSLGAADLFNPKVDRVLDILGIIQNSGDFLKFGYDSMFGNKKAYGGSIHIDPSKKGTFTAAATKHGMGVQEFASKVLANKDDYSPAMVRKANFARNFGGKKKSYGGYMEGGVYDIDIEELNRLINNGYEIELL